MRYHRRFLPTAIGHGEVFPDSSKRREPPGEGYHNAVSSARAAVGDLDLRSIIQQFNTTTSMGRLTAPREGLWPPYSEDGTSSSDIVTLSEYRRIRNNQGVTDPRARPSGTRQEQFPA